MTQNTQHYYEVIVASQKYHKSERLTYSSDQQVPIGTIAIIPLRAEKALCIVTNKVSKPTFTTKPLQPLEPRILAPLPLIRLYDWLAAYYPAPGGLIAGLLLPRYLIAAARKAPLVLPSEARETIALDSKPTDDQRLALDTIASLKSGSIMLHGDTGTGKTLVYLKAAEAQIKSGRSVLALTPEIGLTPQYVASFLQYFPDVVLLHSAMKDSERRNAWRRIAAATEPLVVIGTRSALFAPVQNLGLVILDEFHDGAYKQEQAPYYQTTRVASQLCKLHNAILLLGSATPPISDYFIFDNKKLPIVRMTTKPLQNGSVVLKTINLRKKEHFSKSPWLSDELLESVTQALNNKRQSLIFLNRRGTARLTLCQNCGWQRLCTRCDLPMTFHGDNYSLVCHTCGQTALVPTSCPTCDSTNIIFKSIGTKTIDSEITKLFPNARIQRFDSDIENSERFEHYYKAAKAGEIDILIGTQMLSKGLDLPKLEVVGVVLADTGLYFPDFSASEATYQMITQVIGRVGRGHGMSKVIVQTYDDENAVIRFATTNDYLGFYKSELEERKQYGFPPYYHLLKVSCSYKTAKHAEKTMTDFAVKITDAYPRIKLIGPAPAFIERSHDQYHWQLTLASKDRSALLQILRELPGQFNYDMDPNNLL